MPKSCGRIIPKGNADKLIGPLEQCLRLMQFRILPPHILYQVGYSNSWSKTSNADNRTTFCGKCFTAHSHTPNAPAPAYTHACMHLCIQLHTHDQHNTSTHKHAPRSKPYIHGRTHFCIHCTHTAYTDTIPIQLSLS